MGQVQFVAELNNPAEYEHSVKTLLLLLLLLRPCTRIRALHSPTDLKSPFSPATPLRYGKTVRSIMSLSNYSVIFSMDFSTDQVTL